MCRLWQMVFGALMASIALAAVPQEAIVPADSASTQNDADMARAETAFARGDLVAAMSAYREAALRGHAPAQYRLGYLLDQSDQNVEAERWYRLAADQGSAQAQFALGQLYASREVGDGDMATARKWLMEAARQGQADAVRLLAVAAERGELGMPRSFEEARRWLEQGVAIGDPWSRQRLGRAYRDGELGLRVDRARASELLSEGNRP